MSIGNEHEVMQIIKTYLDHHNAVDSIEIVTENDMEIYIDDYVFRVHIEGDING